MSKKKIRSQQIVSAPGPLTIHNGEQVRTLLVTPPTPADILSVQKWVRANVKPGASEPQGLSSSELVDLSPEDRLIVLKEYANAKASRRELTQTEMLEALINAPGAAYMIWMAARKQHPTLELREVQALINAENVDQVLADFDEACGVLTEDGIDPKAPGLGSSSDAAMT